MNSGGMEDSSSAFGTRDDARETRIFESHARSSSEVCSFETLLCDESVSTSTLCPLLTHPYDRRFRSFSFTMEKKKTKETGHCGRWWKDEEKK